ncbi:MAG: PAS domain-containing protein [Chitinivibrionales bacterium]|nr:PAS domain-containing protein [Chitinivibrionales bacterium]
MGQITRTEAAVSVESNNGAEIDRLREENRRLREREAQLLGQIAALSREEPFMRALMDTIPDNIYFKDCHSRFIRVNRAMAAWFELDDPSEAVGKSDRDFFTPEHARKAFEDERKLLHDGEPLIGIEEKETWPTGKETWVSTTKIAVRDNSGAIVGTCGISRDITRRKQLEEEREALVAELQEAVDRIHTLHGLIPICTVCKRIRDDRGYWHQVESYVADNSTATFSHCLCEECSRKLYPQYARHDTRNSDQSES